MSGPFGEPAVGDGGYTGDANVGQQGNPAWNEFLEVLPQEYHEKVTPLLKKWDEGVNERFQKVHSDYEPWKPIIKTGVDPDTTQFALNLLNSVNENPKMVYDALREYYKFDAAAEGVGTPPVSGAGQGQEPISQDNPYAQEIAQLKHSQQIVADILLAKRQEEEEAHEDAILDKELSSLRQKYGEYDEEFVLAKMAGGMDSENAVKAWVEMVNKIRQSNAPRPLIMGSGGGMPGHGVDPKKLDDKGTKNLVVQMLQAAQQQSQ